MTARRKKWLIIAATVLGVLAILCLWVVPKLVDANRYRPQVEALLEQETGKPARIGRLQLTIFPHLAIEVDNFVLGNPQGFPPGDFIHTRRIDAVLDAGALWNRRIVIRSLVVENPVVHLLSGPGGHWNFENPSQQARRTTAPAQSAPANFSLGKISAISLDGGLVTIANLLPSGEAGPNYFEGRGLSCRFNDVNLSAATTSGSAMINAAKPSLLGVIGSPAIAYAAESGPRPIAQGSFKAAALRFGAIQATSVNSQVWVFPKQAYLDNLTLDLDGGSAKGKAAFDFSGQNLRYNIRTIFDNIDVAKLAEAFPSARGKMTGTMQGHFDVQGEATHSAAPLSGLEGTGQVSIRNGRMPSLQLNRNLMMLARFAGLGSGSGDPAAFSLISTDLNVANQVLTSHNIKIVSNEVDVNGSGSLLLTGPGQLNYTGVAKMAAQQNGLTNLLANVSGATYANGKLAFPFGLRGTLENPKFALASGKGTLGNLLSGAQKSSPGAGSQGNNLIQGITNLFRKK